MENFIAYNPVQLHFGKGVVHHLGTSVQKYGKNVLLLYGGGSVKKNGSYQDVITQLKQVNANIVEYSGIKPNPVLDDVEKALRLVVESKIDVIVALGGGSVIDSAKLISVSALENLNPWDVMKAKVVPSKAIPLITVLTLAATGTEMNASAVVQNPLTKEKVGMAHPLMYPKCSFLDPVYTYTVSPQYTSYGIVDLIAHTFEAFFANGESSLSDKFVQVIVQEAIRYATLVLKEPENYDYRANMLLQSTCALNGITAYGRPGSGDWGVHDLGHTLSFLYDTPHGASLSIVYPAWLKLHQDRIPQRISTLAKLVINTPDINEFLHRLTSFFKQIGSPVKLNDIGIRKEKKQEIVQLMKANRVNGQFHKLNETDYEKLVDFML
jgi:alcohol dehydrogenase YqhD (iron-dependent ADH family)